MGMEMNPKNKKALLQINFIDRYVALSNTYDEKRTPPEERLEIIDIDEIIDTIQGLGYSSKFIKKKFFQLKEEKRGSFVFGFHISLYGGMADLIWVVEEEGKVLLGSTWGTYSRRMINPDYRIRKPKFGEYEDLEEILNIAFQMYEDFKSALVEED